MRSLGISLLLAGIALAPGCASDASEGDLVAAFYPLEFVTRRVVGDGHTVANLTPAGAEPHDLELSARDTASLRDARLVVHLGGFAPALDAAIAELPPDRVLDVTAAAQLEPHDGLADPHDDEHDEGSDAAGHTHAEGTADPHFWLDPIRLGHVAEAVAEQLAAADPGAAAGYRERAAALVAELTALDREFAAGLADCAVTSLVTSHTAFGYLAERYGLTQIGVAGLSPDAEPAAGKLAEVIDFVNEHGVSTIYFETLVDPAVADTVAAETGAVTAVLDPLEGLPADAAGADYFSVMRANLATLRAGQRCS